jgi:hypothetical protein
MAMPASLAKRYNMGIYLLSIFGLYMLVGYVDGPMVSM